MSAKYNPNYDGEFNKVAVQSFESTADDNEADSEADTEPENDSYGEDDSED